MNTINFSDKQDKLERFAHSNKLIEARYSLSLHQQRLVLMMAAMITPYDSDFQEYKIEIRELANYLNIKGDSVIENVRNAAKSLVDKSITIIDENRILYASWLSSAEFPNGTSHVKLCFDPKLKPYLLQLKERYTYLENKYLIQLRSVYSIRIYMLLKQYSKMGYRVFDVESLREMLGIQSAEYPRFYDFNLNVIKRAESDINGKTDLQVSSKISKKINRKIVEITFTIEEKKQFDIPGLEELPYLQDNNEEIGIGNDEQIGTAQVFGEKAIEKATKTTIKLPLVLKSQQNDEEIILFFETFWKRFRPNKMRKGDKEGAEKIFNRLILDRKSPLSPVDLILATDLYCRDCLDKDIPTCHVTTYLNQKRFQEFLEELQEKKDEEIKLTHQKAQEEQKYNELSNDPFWINSKEKLTSSEIPDNFKKYINELSYFGKDGDIHLIKFPSKFTRDWFKKEYKSIFDRIFNKWNLICLEN